MATNPKHRNAAKSPPNMTLEPSIMAISVKKDSKAAMMKLSTNVSPKINAIFLPCISSLDNPASRCHIFPNKAFPYHRNAITKVESEATTNSQILNPEKSNLLCFQ